jgi:hypothetical protein
MPSPEVAIVFADAHAQAVEAATRRAEAHARALAAEPVTVRTSGSYGPTTEEIWLRHSEALLAYKYSGFDTSAAAIADAADTLTDRCRAYSARTAPAPGTGLARQAPPPAAYASPLAETLDTLSAATPAARALAAALATLSADLTHLRDCGFLLLSSHPEPGRILAEPPHGQPPVTLAYLQTDLLPATAAESLCRVLSLLIEHGRAAALPPGAL